MTTNIAVLEMQDIVRKGFGVPFMLVLLLAMMILPIPPFLLDFFFTFNITISLIVLLAGVYTLRPLDFASFPTVILVTTLTRLALNVASTRVVLINGHTGAHAAGEVIESFGKVVIGGNYAVGIVVFTILVIINFVVVTKGAGRISEVSARFTLDSLPGKQMAIDADLNAGIITQEEAKARREELTQEADFYGSMDGASKFVRGDAIAGILILILNLIGGTLIGMLQHGLSFVEAMQIYALLTIGDGLVAQIPSLILSTSAAMMVTRVSREENVSEQVFSQVVNNPKPLLITSCIMFILGIIPGMPHIAFLGMSALVAYFGSRLMEKEASDKINEQHEAVIEQQQKEAENDKPKDLDWDDVPPVDIIGLEVGYRLIPLVDQEQSGELMSRIKGVRKKLSQELGFLVPAIHIRDNLDLQPNAYRISLLGVTLGESNIEPEKDMAINPGQVFGEVAGHQTKDPAFGLDAYWIEKSQREHAQTQGYTVVDASTVVATHLSQLLNSHAHQLLGHEQVQKLMDLLAEESPKLVEDLVPKLIPLATLVKVLQNLLYEHVSIRDIRTISETLSSVAQTTQEPVSLTAQVRINLGPMIVQQIVGFTQELPVITFTPSLEQLLQRTLQSADDNNVALEPNLAESMQNSLRQASESQEMVGDPVILLVSGPIRWMMSRFVKGFIPSMNVLSYQEIPDDKQIKIIATIGD